MIEGFAVGLAPGDWELQMNRVLWLVRRGRIVIGQSYPAVDDIQTRMFSLGSYLLVKGSRTCVNLEVQPEWFPEYDLDLGRRRRAGASRPARSAP